MASHRRGSPRIVSHLPTSLSIAQHRPVSLRITSHGPHRQQISVKVKTDTKCGFFPGFPGHLEHMTEIVSR
jgi:recombinational DNA repair ATPase RecF